MAEDNPLPRFHELLDEAADDAMGVDLYDVNSDDPVSLAEFRGLLAVASHSAVLLVEYCAANEVALLEALERSDG